MLIIPFLKPDELADKPGRQSILCFLSGMLSSFYPSTPVAARELLVAPRDNDVASELLYAAAYGGVPDAQFELAQWSFSAGNTVEAAAWAGIVKKQNAAYFLEERSGRTAIGVSMRLDMQIDSQFNRPALSNARKELARKVRDRERELAQKCKQAVKCRQQMVEFVEELEKVGLDRAPRTEVVGGLAWFGFQLVCARLVTSPTFLFERNLNLDPKNIVANAFQESSGRLGSHDLANGAIGEMALLIRQTGEMPNGIGWT
jgi:hypothetical protein